MLSCTTARDGSRPQASGTAICTWQVWDQAGVVNTRSAGITAKLIGVDAAGNPKYLSGLVQDAAAIGTIGSYNYTAQSTLTAMIRYDAGDKWKVSNYVATDPSVGTVTVDPNPAHTLWQCMAFSD